MVNQKISFHGSDIEKIAEAYGIKKEEITNFSANVNPLGISPMLRKALAEHVDAIRTYPDRDYTGLREAIAGYAGTDCQNIVVGNGATELISLLIRTVNPKKTLVIAPTYSEYEREIALNGGSCQYYALRETEKFVLDLGDFLGQLQPGVELLILCNPNNPTSSLVGRQEMEELLEACRKQGIFVLVDETYMEFVAHYESVTAVPLVKRFENMAVLRGTSKFFAVPGLRLGYAITGNRRFLETIRRQQNPWSLHSLAAVAGGAMFGDEEYIAVTREVIARERERMYVRFADDTRFQPYVPTANFMLLRIRNKDISSEMLFERAIREKMMIRDCSDFLFLDKEYIHFCFLNPEQNDRLAECLLSPDMEPYCA